ncbi:putative quinol monooxygenase [Vibrio astriarenae]|jgi:quinol monooxygenase YgiN
MGKVILKGMIEVPEEELDNVLAHMEQHIALTRAEEGCEVFEITADPNDICRFTVYEEFDSVAAFEAHQERVKASVWGHVTQNVRRDYQIYKDAALVNGESDTSSG